MDLFDTNVLSELRKPRPEPRVVSFLRTRRLEEGFISILTITEIQFGIDRASDPALKAELERWLMMTVRASFFGRTLELSEEVLLRWRILLDVSRKAGRPYSQPDLLLAATALEHGLTLVTRNVRDFAGLGLTIVNPWDFS